MGWINNVFGNQNLISPQIETSSKRDKDKLLGTSTKVTVPNNFCEYDDNLQALQNDIVAYNCYVSLFNIVYDRKWQVIGDKDNFYTNKLKSLDIDTFLRKCFWEMLMRYDNALILFDDEGYPFLKPFKTDSGLIDVTHVVKKVSGRLVGYDVSFREHNKKIFYSKEDVYHLKSCHGEIGSSAIFRAKDYIKAKGLEIAAGQKHAATGHYPKIVGSIDWSSSEKSELSDTEITNMVESTESAFKGLVSDKSAGAMFTYPVKDLKMLQPQYFDFDKTFNAWDKQICYAFLMPPSFLGSTQQANFKTEQDRDNLIESSVAEYRRTLENVADYILSEYSEVYKEENLTGNLRFTFGDPLTDEKLRVRQQLQNSFTLYVQNKDTIEEQGFTFDTSNLESLGFIRKKISKTTEKDFSKAAIPEKELLDIVYSAYYESVNLTLPELKKWKENEISLLATESRPHLDTAINLLSTKKEDWTSKHIKEAKKAISYISKAKEIGKGKVTNQTYPFGRNEIALKNWGYKLN